MPFVISAGTSVVGFTTATAGGLPNQVGFGDKGIISISLQIVPQLQRLYHLGYQTPYDRNTLIQKTLSITSYAGSTRTYSTLASTSCDEPDPINISITSSNCGGDPFSDQTDWFVEGYSYQKDVQGWGQETWQLVSRPLILDAALNQISPTEVEVRMIRGVAEGQTTTDGAADTGIVFLTTNVIDQVTVPGFGFIGSLDVQAASPGIGRANYLRFGEVEQIGLGTGKRDGVDGQGQVQIPYTPIYIPK